MRMSDLVAGRILELMERSGGTAEIRRNELAGFLGCAPSQINYVITSRFTPEQGYAVESRRGGGGYIRIRQVKMDQRMAVMHIVNAVGDTLDASSARAMLEGMLYRGILNEKEAMLIAAAVQAGVLQAAGKASDRIRAGLLKNMLLALI